MRRFYKWKYFIFYTANFTEYHRLGKSKIACWESYSILPELGMICKELARAGYHSVVVKTINSEIASSSYHVINYIEFGESLANCVIQSTPADN